MSTSPKPNGLKDHIEIFFRAFWCFSQCVEAIRHSRIMLSIDGTFVFGKYKGTLLVAISCDTDNALVPLAFLWWRGITKIVGVSCCVLFGSMLWALVGRLVSYLIDIRVFLVQYKSKFLGMHLCSIDGALITL
jgi:predicted permease